MPTLDVVTLGEALGSLLATQVGPLDDATHFERRLAGSEVNTAIALARLGHRVGYLGTVGDDLFGKAARARFEAENVDTTMLTTSRDAATGLQIKERVVGRDPTYVYYRQGSAGSKLAAAPDVLEYLTAARHLHVTGIPLAISPSARHCAFKAVETARNNGLPVSFDPNLRPVLWPDHKEMVDVVNALAIQCDWVLPGHREGTVLTGSSEPEGIAQFYLSRGVRGVVIKLGSRGALLYTANAVWRCPPFAVEVVDTLGAGDGFAAGFISALIDGEPAERALERACAVGAIATTSEGDCDGMPIRAELADFMAAHHGTISEPVLEGAVG
ncbi:sugar kinase [Micromonospora sp. MP36]|nr:sugar kinase [Micromonospora sp. MP36]